MKNYYNAYLSTPLGSFSNNSTHIIDLNLF